MRIAVTGSAGFIGSTLCDVLLERGDEVIGFDCFDDFYDPRVKRSNLSGALRQSAFELVEGDITEQRDLERLFAVGGFDAVIHLAARAGVRQSLERPADYMHVNVTGTTLLLDHARQAGCPHFVFGSSSSVYGATAPTPFSETYPAIEPESVYAASKRSAELVVETYRRLYGMSAVCLRFFTVYGPRQRPDMAIHKFARKIVAGIPVQLYGDGSSQRDYTYVADIVSGIVAAAGRIGHSGTYNLGADALTKLDELVDLLGSLLGRRPEIERVHDQLGDVPITRADIGAAQTELDYRVTTSLSDGLARFVEWFLLSRQ